MKYTDIIWDFNGTVIDDVDVGIRSVNKMLSERALPTIPDRESYRRVFGFPIIEYYRRLGFDLDSEPFELLAPLWVEEYNKNSAGISLRERVRELIELFASRRVRQHVISATERSMLEGQLKQFGLYAFFDDVRGLDNIHAASKTAIAEIWRHEHKEALALFIGDTEHDFDTARAIGADCVLVGGGHRPTDALALCRCPVFDSPSALYEAIVSDSFRV